MLNIFGSYKIDKNSRQPLYIQLYEKLKNMVESGILLPDTKLPRFVAWLIYSA